MRLIDADKVIELIEDEIIDCDDDTVLANGCRAGLTYARSIVATRPTIDAEPVRRGKWEYAEDEVLDDLTFSAWKCSCCGYYAYKPELWHYCPKCGARMDGGTEDDG